MFSILAKIFIKDANNISDPKVRQKYGMLSGIIGIFLNICLFIGKFLAGTISNSIAITADAFNNLSDAGSSVITLIGFKMAGQKPDPEHPFGHGRIEYISGLLVSIAILIMAFELIKSSIKKIIFPEQTAFDVLVVIILIVSILVKGYMAMYNKKIGKKIDSLSMIATSVDSFSDMIATSVVLFAAIFAKIFKINIDGFCRSGSWIIYFIFRNKCCKRDN